MDQLPERPSDTVTPPAPTLKIGPQHCKISVHMRQRNGDNVTVFLENGIFHVNTLTQRPRYYLTCDLRAELGKVKLDDEKAFAKFKGQTLEVIVPLLGSQEEIQELRKKPKKRAREQIADVTSIAAEAAAAKKLKNKKNKKKKKDAAASGQKADSGRPSARKQETNRTTVEEGRRMDELLDMVTGAVEQRENDKLDKIAKKEQWMQEQHKKKDEQRQKKNAVKTALRTTVKEVVVDSMSKDAIREKKKDRKHARKEAATKKSKPRKSVSFK